MHSFAIKFLNRRRLADLVLIASSYFLTCFLSEGLDTANSKLRLTFALCLITWYFLSLLPATRREQKWRTVSTHDAFLIAQSITLATFALMFVTSVFAPKRDLNRWLCLNAILTIGALAGMRLGRRIYFERQNFLINERVGRRALIIGTGSAARSLAARFAHDLSLATCLIGFVDVEPSQLGGRVGGVNVLGGFHDLPRLIKDNLIQDLIVADSSVGADSLREILEMTQRQSVKVKILRDDPFVLNFNGAKEELREVDLQDLLPRPPVLVDLESVARAINDRTVLVTGGGGSIGSELVRQIATFGPRRILILDQCEFNLYAIENEMKQSACTVPITLLLSDLKERSILEKIFEQHRPDFIFHAAAYKHVHLVETNPYAAILNNLVSTRNLLHFAQVQGVRNFLLISSDKAVNPVGVMGATKRACELLVTQAAEESGFCYCAVRFGNVLGSSGSFIPLLKQQIAKGGPITITHKDMERFFMLIPEAVSLVLKAASISNPGDISILKMGQSIKIIDIVKTLMMLMGKSDQSIPIVFTGMRPGEKLKEELYLTGNEIETHVPNIMVLPHGAQSSVFPLKSVLKPSQVVERLIVLAERSDQESLRLLNSFTNGIYRDYDFEMELAAQESEVELATDAKNQRHSA